MLNEDPEKIEAMAKQSYEIMEQIAERSKSEKVDLVVDHELKGVSPEMIDWWWHNIKDSERYKLWHPDHHISFEWEKLPEEGEQFGAIQRVIETINVPTMLRIRWEDPSSQPIKATYDHLICGGILNSKDEPVGWILHEYEPNENGTHLRTTFRLPKKVPRWFIKALREHNIEEIGEFQNFLPKLYEENK